MKKMSMKKADKVIGGYYIRFCNPEKFEWGAGGNSNTCYSVVECRNKFGVPNKTINAVANNYCPAKPTPTP
ncbi:hypothetical protein D781_0931 [Serratia sp. FGI94]|uniref:DUF4762 family protein n=1 Tax=Serratia sp. FGI94 TaxID=671990 RepID=UPI0002A724B3|nr:DUF4762 family protein [Serratia sp. FGI94]AGB81263.1 hypothetical protein D781_0931 [Serratia sp. FGI94]